MCERVDSWGWQSGPLDPPVGPLPDGGTEQQHQTVCGRQQHRQTDHRTGTRMPRHHPLVRGGP